MEEDAGHGLVSHTVRFCRTLRERGLLVGPSETADAIRSLALIDLMDRQQVYLALKTVLVSRAEEMRAFDECFQEFWSFDLSHAASAPILKPTEVHGLQSTDGPDAQQSRDQQASGIPVTRTGASPVEVLGGRDLTAFQEANLAEVSSIASRTLRAIPTRLGRRRRRHMRKGLPDLRGAFRKSLSHGGELVSLPRRRRVPRTPRLVVLLDASGSMDRHARLLLQLVYALGQRAGRVETFVFSTSLTRVTRQLRAPSFYEALCRIGAVAPHWSGGTRIGTCLEALNRTYAYILDRDTSVFLMSDGWETGDPDHLARELHRLRRRVRRLVWLNPLLGTQDYEPLTLGLQAARTHVDTFASAKDLAQLKRLPRLLRG